ncbi:MAG TPA: hypothetical protein VHQ65_04260 [Thermoanaerobaculia bacterium]|nr:hypothetical protein [Thermoanaerobaculia bacterium]
MNARTWNLVAPAVLLILVAGCDPKTRAADHESGERRGPATADPTNLVVIFDPTILEAADGERFEKILDDLETYLDAAFDHGGSLVVFEVDGDVLHAPPLFERDLQRKETFDRDSQLKKQVLQVSAELRQELLGSWERAHADPERQRLNSCLLTALHRADQYRQANSSGSAEMLVFSDLLEACDDGGKMVNFELRLPQHEAWAKEEAPNLGNYDQVTVIQLPNRHWGTRDQNSKLRKLWEEMLGRSGTADFRLLLDVPKRRG